MNTATAIMISSIMVLAAVIVITRTISRANSDANEAKRQGDMMDFIREQERNRDLAEREARAASFYTLKIAMDTVQTQAAAQAQVSKYTAQALANAVDGLKADRKALETLETRAVVDAYTKMLQNQKKEAKRIATKEEPKKIPQQDRYWEGVDYFV